MTLGLAQASVSASIQMKEPDSAASEVASSSRAMILHPGPREQSLRAPHYRLTFSGAIHLVSVLSKRWSTELTIVLFRQRLVDSPPTLLIIP